MFFWSLKIVRVFSVKTRVGMRGPVCVLMLLTFHTTSYKIEKYFLQKKGLFFIPLTFSASLSGFNISLLKGTGSRDRFFKFLGCYSFRKNICLYTSWSYFEPHTVYLDHRHVFVQNYPAFHWSGQQANASCWLEAFKNSMPAFRSLAYYTLVGIHTAHQQLANQILSLRNYTTRVISCVCR